MKELRKTSTSSNNEKKKQIDLSRLWSKRSVDEYGKPTERLELASVSTPENPKLLGGHINPHNSSMQEANDSDSDEGRSMDDLRPSSLRHVIYNERAPRTFRNRLDLIFHALEETEVEIR